MNSLLGIVLLGIGASLATEAITWLNALLNKTVLKGDGAFILAIVVSFIFGFFKVYLTGTPMTLTNLSIVWTQTFAISQVAFVFIVNWLGLTVQSNSPTTPGAATPQA